MPDYVRLNLEQTISEVDPFTEERYAQFIRYLGFSTGRVLDVGCNTGRGGQRMKQLCPKLSLVALDCVEDRLRRLLPGVYDSVVCSFTQQIDQPDGSFDAIVAGEFIEHLAVEDVEPTLQEFFRIINSNGRLLLTTPNPGYIRLKLTGGSVLGGPHLSQHWPKDLGQRLNAIGFRNVRIRPSGKVTRYFGEWFPWLNLYGSYLAVAEKP
jgi:2-polyprenyl-3-methyl-5-hydroxy-6-metoxy-1,4-benzoquinol methylase